MGTTQQAPKMRESEIHVSSDKRNIIYSIKFGLNEGENAGNAFIQAYKIKQSRGLEREVLVRIDPWADHYILDVRGTLNNKTEERSRLIVECVKEIKKELDYSHNGVSIALSNAENLQTLKRAGTVATLD